MSPPLVPQCGHCAVKAPTPLTTTCSKCHAVVYCNPAQPNNDAKHHTKVCKKVVVARQQCDGRPSRDRDAIEEALREACECVTLDEQDHQGIREEIPALMLLLGKVQEAYDFLYWWAGNHDNDDNDEDYEEREEEDEEMDEENQHQLSNTALDEAAPAPLRSFLQANNLPTTVEELVALHEKVLAQAKQTCDMAHPNNSHLWPILVDPVAALSHPPSMYQSGTADEVRQHLYAQLGHATPFAIDYIAKQLHD